MGLYNLEIPFNFTPFGLPNTRTNKVTNTHCNVLIKYEGKYKSSKYHFISIKQSEKVPKKFCKLSSVSESLEVEPELENVVLELTSET